MNDHAVNDVDINPLTVVRKDGMALQHVDNHCPSPIGQQQCLKSQLSRAYGTKAKAFYY